jgi:hypothetical protein
MAEVHEAVEVWDGASEPPDEIKQHIRDLHSGPSEHEKVNTYVQSYAGEDPADPRHELFAPVKPA